MGSAPSPWVWVAGVVLLTLGMAGASKLADLSAFRRSISGWWRLPVAVRDVMTIGVPMGEVAVASMWGFGIGRRSCEWCALGALVAYTIGYAVHVVDGRVPACGCFGSLAPGAERAWWVMGRNGAMIAALGGSMLAGRSVRSEVSVDHGEGQDWGRVEGSVPRGFTVIELMLVVALVGVLGALVASHVAEFRRSARDAASMANARTHAAVMAAYSGDSREVFPYFVDPDATYSVVRCRATGEAYRGRYFQAGGLWNVALADGYYNGDPRHGSFRSPHTVGGGLAYYYPCVFVADPEHWRRETRRAPPAQLGPTRWSQVTTPEKKAVISATGTMWEWVGEVGGKARARPSGYAIASFVAGNARVVRPRDAVREEPGGDGAADFRIVHGGTVQGELMHTRDGVRGRDVP